MGYHDPQQRRVIVSTAIASSSMVTIFVVMMSYLVLFTPFSSSLSSSSVQPRNANNSFIFSTKQFSQRRPPPRKTALGAKISPPPPTTALSLSSSSSSSNNPPILLSSTGFLSHVMLKVPNVDETVDYWLSQGGKIRISRPIDDDDNGEQKQQPQPKLQSAFIEMGCSSSSNSRKSSANDEEEEDEESSPPVTFALELVKTNSGSNNSNNNNNSQEESSSAEQEQQPPSQSYKLGNEISYIGISKLLLFQNNLLGVITGEATAKGGGEEEERLEPNGMNVQSSASAPGDFFARFCLRTNDLVATTNFYSDVLGMDIKAQDDTMVCLRYDNDIFPSSTMGVATTLVFENADDDNDQSPIIKGDCFDHLAITTSSKIDDLYTQLTTISSSSSSSSSSSNNDDDDDDDDNNIINTTTNGSNGIGKEVTVFMKPTDMFGKRVMGLLDPNGYKVVIAGR